MKFKRKYRKLLRGNGLEVNLELIFSNLEEFRHFLLLYKPDDFKGINVAVICTDKCQQCGAVARSSLAADRLMLFAHRYKEQTPNICLRIYGWLLSAISGTQEKGRDVYCHFCSTCELHDYGSFGQVCAQMANEQKEISALKAPGAV